MERIHWQELPKGTVILIGVNVVFFLYVMYAGSFSDSRFMLQAGVLYPPSIWEEHEFYRLITAMFLHFGPEHLFFNMLLLYFLGSLLEKTFGSLLFLFIYLFSGLIGNVVSLIYYSVGDINVLSAGASGAVFGLVGVVAYMVFANRGYFEGISSRRIILMIVFSLYSGFTGGGVNNTAHVAGLLAGALCGMIFYRERNRGSKGRY
ncbi:MAG: rhomboid family intramembrane serine protease [Lachnospiraceae bacterium]|nr:rhomboid family intramembrane serine protease [Lachnospiraceae bacterium]